MNLSMEQIFLSVAVMCFVVVLLVKLGKRNIQWDLRRYYAINRHHWCYTDLFTQPSCSVCETMIVASGGAFCDCCGVCTDSKDCMRRADTDLSCKPMMVNADYTSHHWVKGNLPLTSCICKVCGEECGEGVGLRDLLCVWCEVTVHSQCKASISLLCDFGAMRDFVVPPHCTQLGRARLRRGLRLRKIEQPRDVTNWSPVIVIGNVSAGSSEAETVLSSFRRILNPVQVVDVSSVKVEEAVRWCKMLHEKLLQSPSGERRVRLIIAGGDGTIGWVLNTLHKRNLMHCVDICLVPLGTGNDLARVLGWGGSLSTSFDAAEYLGKIGEASPQKLDRWLTQYTPAPPRSNILTKVIPMQEIFMNNYLSIGVDALVTLRFHQARQSPFYLFNSRLLNKMIYFGYGTKDVLEHSCENLDSKLKLFMDGVEVELPSIEALVVLNISSWGAGCRPWSLGSGGKEAPSQKTDDGYLEVMGISSSFHICQLQMGISEPTRLGQCKFLEIRISGDMALPMQVDGEPWEQQPGVIKVTYSHGANMMALPQ